MRDGLYYFQEKSMVKANVVEGSISSLELWHKHLGHPSEKVVRLLYSVSVSEDKLNKVCEVGHRAKRSRDRFPLSNIQANQCFEMIHYDLWGPYNMVSSCGARYF